MFRVTLQMENKMLRKLFRETQQNRRGQGGGGGKFLNYWLCIAMVLWYILLKKLAKKISGSHGIEP